MGVYVGGVKMEDKAAYTDVVSYGPLQNNWVDYGAPWALTGFMKDTQGIVHLKGLVKSGNTASGTIIVVLPVGYRPAEKVIFLCPCWEAGVLKHARIDVEEDGAVRIKNTIANDWLSLSGISFVAA